MPNNEKPKIDTCRNFWPFQIVEVFASKRVRNPHSHIFEVLKFGVLGGGCHFNAFTVTFSWSQKNSTIDPFFSFIIIIIKLKNNYCGN